MREIKYVVIHHSITPRDLSLQKSVESFNNTHKKIHLEPNSKDLHIAYHWVIAGDGSKMETRGLDEVGYHATNLPVNKESLGICLTGNFDEEYPSDEQIKTLKKLLLWICNEFNVSPENIIGHKDVYDKKSCPGDHLYAMLPELRKYVEVGNTVSDWAKDPWNWAKENGLISDESDPQKTLTKEELTTILYRYNNLNK